MIAIPESVAFYWREPANQAAIKVLAGNTEVPPDLSLDEVERFEMASLAAERVRLDFWRMLRSIWSTTFGQAVRSALPSARLLSFGEHAVFEPASDFTPSVQRAWRDGDTFGVYEVPSHGHLVTWVWLDPASTERAAALEFYFLSTERRLEIGDSLDLGDDWGKCDGWRATQSRGLGVSSDGTMLDPTPLGILSRSAMTTLSEALASKRANSSATNTGMISSVRRS